jgi:hypothetical protein
MDFGFGHQISPFLSPLEQREKVGRIRNSKSEIAGIVTENPSSGQKERLKGKRTPFLTVETNPLYTDPNDLNFGGPGRSLWQYHLF